VPAISSWRAWPALPGWTTPSLWERQPVRGGRGCCGCRPRSPRQRSRNVRRRRGLTCSQGGCEQAPVAIGPPTAGRGVDWRFDLGGVSPYGGVPAGEGIGAVDRGGGFLVGWRVGRRHAIERVAFLPRVKGRIYGGRSGPSQASRECLSRAEGGRDIRPDGPAGRNRPGDHRAVDRLRHRHEHLFCHGGHPACP